MRTKASIVFIMASCLAQEGWAGAAPFHGASHRHASLFFSIAFADQALAAPSGEVPAAQARAPARNARLTSDIVRIGELPIPPTVEDMRQRLAQLRKAAHEYNGRNGIAELLANYPARLFPPLGRLILGELPYVTGHVVEGFETSLESMDVPLPSWNVNGLAKGALEGGNGMVDPATGFPIDKGAARRWIISRLRSGEKVDVTHVDEDLGEGALLRMEEGSPDQIVAQFGNRHVLLALDSQFNNLQLGHRTPEAGEALLKVFRNREGVHPALNLEIVRRLYLVRQALTPDDLVWLSQELAAGHVTTPKAKEWFFYLIHQRQRRWAGMTEPLRDQVTAALEKAKALLSEPMYVGLLFAVWTPLTLSEQSRELPADILKRWPHATVAERLFWIRKAAHQITVSAHKDFAAPLDIADALRFPGGEPSFIRFFNNRSPLPAMALGVASVRTTPLTIEAASWIAKDSPDDILFVSDVAQVLGRTSGRLRSWVKSKYHKMPSRYLMEKYELLPDLYWTNVLIHHKDLSKPPSPFERRVMRTFIREWSGARPFSELSDIDLFQDFLYRGHALSLAESAHLFRKGLANKGWVLLPILLDYYGLGNRSKKTKTTSIEEMHSLDDILSRLRQGTLRVFPWARLALDTKPDLLLAILHAIGEAVGKPGRGILWLTEEKDFGKRLEVFGNRRTRLLFRWGETKWKKDPNPDKPRSVVFYLAHLAGVKLTASDVQLALQNGWAHRNQLKAVPENLLAAA